MSCLFLCGERQFTNYSTVVMFGTLEMKDVLPTCPFCSFVVKDNLPATVLMFVTLEMKDVLPTCHVCFFVVKDNLPTTVLMFGTLEMKDVLPTCPICYFAIEDNLPTCPIFWSIAKKDFFTNLSCLVLGRENFELLKNI